MLVFFTRCQSLSCGDASLGMILSAGKHKGAGWGAHAHRQPSAAPGSRQVSGQRRSRRLTAQTGADAGGAGDAGPELCRSAAGFRPVEESPAAQACTDADDNATAHQELQQHRVLRICREPGTAGHNCGDWAPSSLCRRVRQPADACKGIVCKRHVFPDYSSCSHWTGGQPDNTATWGSHPGLIHAAQHRRAGQEALGEWRRAECLEHAARWAEKRSQFWHKGRCSVQAHGWRGTIIPRSQQVPQCPAAEVTLGRAVIICQLF